MEDISNWGFYPEIKANVNRPSSFLELDSLIANKHQVIARGNGRCYGDSSLQEEIISTTGMKKILAFDAEKGIINCESGILLSDMLSFLVPKGYFLPVTPGTKFVTLGGAVASNIHGKNHHKEGALSSFINSLELLNGEGETLHCNATENADLFKATIGGMGLTGIIVSVEIRLKKIHSSYIKQTATKAKNIHELLDLFEAQHECTYSVAWIDCLSKGKKLGRSILMVGEHAELDELGSSQRKNPLRPHSVGQINVPFKFPSFVLNWFTIKIFNILYYFKQFSKEKKGIIHYDKFFYPLDSINNWNRIYGKNGFTQYQFVIPFENGKEGMLKILTKIASSGQGSFLAVLKTFGEADSLSSSLSFPMKGYTLALDFKLSDKVLKLLDELDQIVIEYNGKVYLTKDSRMEAKVFHQMYDSDRGNTDITKFNSIQSERLNIKKL